MFKLIDREPVFFGEKSRPGVMETYKAGKQIRYVLRAGKKGTGQTVAVARCVWGCVPQARAMERLRRQAGGPIVSQWSAA